MRLTEQRYWEEKARAAEDEEPGFMFYGEIARHLPPGPGLSFLEIGCAPGRILAEFGRRLDYELHGVDYAADATAIEGYLRGHGCTVGEVVRADVFDWDPGRTYDVVSSFGVVEHFDDPGPLIDRHFELAAPGGRVVIGLPNFARGQHLLHWLFDRENLRRHNLRCMSLGYLRDAAHRNGAGVVELRYTGGHYDFWPEVTRSARLGVAEDDPRVRASPLSAVHLALRDRSRRRPEQGNPLLSPYILGIFSERRLIR